ncbi:MAG: hypothetical protein U5J64_01280 [Halobacteriales archaeon]|nr:hypothetical protein [Halobacteriales archaeon]
MTATQDGQESASAFGGIDARTVATAVVGGLVLGAYAMWITADLLPRALTFIFVTLGVGGILYRRADGREQLVYAGYVLAGLLFLTPIMMILPDVLSAGTYGVSALSLVFVTVNIVLFVVFLILAAVVAFLSYRFS